MEFSIKVSSPELLKSGCLIAGVHEGGALSTAAATIDRATGGQLTRLVARGDLDGKPGSTLLVHHLDGLAAERILLIGLGKEGASSEKDLLTAIRAAIKAVSLTGAKEAHLLLPDRVPSTAWAVRQTVMIASEVGYRFDQYKTAGENPPRPLRRLVIAPAAAEDLKAAKQAMAEGMAIAGGVTVAKTLGNLPPNVCTPTYLARQVSEMTKELGLDCKVLDRADMEKLGMNSLLAVSQGSKQPPKLIVAHYRGGKKTQKPVVMVGKGVTFDSGGISLKPGEGMDEMKFDMCGAASVIGALRACAELKLPLNLSIIVPATENMPGGAATRPGDIVASMSGQTIEILNTDAEGRLILCDALSYAERLSPAVVIDVATLTGACVIALGHVASGLFSSSDELSQSLVDAGNAAADRAWPMPLWDDYQEQLKSNFADMANIGGRPAGAVTAACFLSRFVKYADWAHLDIAGTAWKSGADKGATGRPVALLTHFLMARAAAQ